MLPVVVEGQTFGCPFALIIAASFSNAVDITPVRFFLGVFQWVAVHLMSKCKKVGSDAAYPSTLNLLFALQSKLYLKLLSGHQHSARSLHLLQVSTGHANRPGGKE